MTTNRIIATIVIVTILLMALFGWYVVSSNSTTDTGPVSTIKKTIGGFFPFGNSDAPATNQNSNSSSATGQNVFGSSTQNVNIPVATVSRLKQITSEPVAGASIFSVPVPKQTKSTSTSTPTTTPSDYIVYIEQGTGHVYKEAVDSPTQELLSATTIPKVDAAFVGQKNAVAYQYFKNDNETLETFLGQIVPDTSTTTATFGKVAGNFLPQDIYRFAMAATGDRIFYLTQGIDSDTGYVANADGTKSTAVITTPVREWDISWPNTNTLLMTTAPDSSVQGYLFALNLSTKTSSQVLGGINGLTAIASPDLSYYIYSASTYNGFTTHIYRPKDGFDASIPLVTLPEKCTWSSVNNTIAYCAVPASIPSATYPESWYRGDVSFADNIWKLDLKAGTSTEVLQASQQFQNGQTADMIDLSVDQGDHYLIFKNKVDNTLWQYHLDTISNSL